MRLKQDGTPVIANYDESQAVAAFAEKLARTIHGRLPRIVRLFLSVDTLIVVIGLGIRSLANRASDATPS